MFHFVHCMFDCKHGRLLDLSNNTLVGTLSSLPALPAMLTYVCGACIAISQLFVYFLRVHVHVHFLLYSTSC